MYFKNAMLHAAASFVPSRRPMLQIDLQSKLNGQLASSGIPYVDQGKNRGGGNPGVRTLGRRRGFTLIELMVVIVLIGLMAGAVSMVTRSFLVSGKQGVAKMEIANICQALDTFYSTFDRYPTNDEGINILTVPSDKFVDGLLSKKPRDPWGNSYQYNSPGRSRAYEVICYGADGREGGEGADRDLSSEELDVEKKR
jgi:general secretion pathway protein G